MENNYSATKEGFVWFSSVMEKLGFNKICNKEIRKTCSNLNFKYKKKEGEETGFSFKNENNNYKVKVWTTFLEKEDKMRDLGEDVGFVIIVLEDPLTKKEKLIYSARYFLRSNKNFFLSLARYAWIAKWKINHVPHCKVCGEKMQIKRKIGTRQYFWKCTGLSHLKLETLPWDYGLPPKATLFLKIRRNNTKLQKDRLKKEGKSIPVPKALTRYRVRRNIR